MNMDSFFPNIKPFTAVTLYQIQEQG